MLGKSVSATILRIGLILGAARVAVNLLAAQAMGPTVLFESIPLAAIALMLTITLMIYAGFRIRKDNGGLIDLQTAFLALLGVYAVAGIVSAASNGLMFHVFFPAWMGEVAAYADRLSSFGMLRELASSLIQGGLLSMIFAFFLRREKVRIREVK